MRKTVFLIVRLWRDKWSNTYHTVRVIIPSESIDIKSVVTHGYDLRHRDTAEDMLRTFRSSEENDKGKKVKCLAYLIRSRTGVVLYEDIVTVNAKKHLEAGEWY